MIQGRQEAFDTPWNYWFDYLTPYQTLMQKVIMPITCSLCTRQKLGFDKHPPEGCASQKLLRLNLKVTSAFVQRRAAALP